MVVHRFRYGDDVYRIWVALVRAGYDVTLRDAEDLWEHHSADWCAGWLELPEKDEDIIGTLAEYLE